MIFTILLLMQNLYAENFQCSYKEPSSYKAYKSAYQKKVEKLANNKPMAALADATLSKLITAKSPIIFNWLKSRKLTNAPVEKIAKQWRLYYARYFALNKYPSNNKTINKSIETLVDSTLPAHINFAKYKKLFNAAKKLSLKTVESWKINAASKKSIRQRMSAVQLFWPVPFKNAKEKSALDVLEWSVHYDPLSNQVKMGAEVLKYPGDATITAVFAHEIGHSIDPCRWGAFIKQTNPFDKLYSCLRDAKAAGAKSRDQKTLEKMHSTKKLSKTQYTMMKMSPYCNKSFYPPAGVQKEQLNETFADWFSAEAMAHSKIINMNLRNDLCADKKLSTHSSYIANTDRLKKIYFTQPVIAKKLQLKLAYKYCKL